MQYGSRSAKRSNMLGEATRSPPVIRCSVVFCFLLGMEVCLGSGRAATSLGAGHLAWSGRNVIGGTLSHPRAGRNSFGGTGLTILDRSW